MRLKSVCVCVCVCVCVYLFVKKFKTALMTSFTLLLTQRSYYLSKGIIFVKKMPPFFIKMLESVLL